MNVFYNNNQIRLTCMFHVRGRCVDTVVVTVAPDAVAVVAVDC